MTVRYRNGPAESAIHAGMLLAPTLRRQRFRHYDKVGVWTALLALAVWCAHRADSHFSFVVFLCAATYYLNQNYSFDRAVRKLIASREARATEREVRLMADDDGLHELAEGIRSNARWESVLNYRVYREVLFVSLSAGMLSVIPKDSFFSGDGSFRDFIDLLREHGVREAAEPSLEPPAGLF